MDLGDRIQKHVYILFKWDKGFKIVRNLEPFSRFPQNPYHMECFLFGYTLSYCTQDGIINFKSLRWIKFVHLSFHKFIFNGENLNFFFILEFKEI